MAKRRTKKEIDAQVAASNRQAVASTFGIHPRNETLKAIYEVTLPDADVLAYCQYVSLRGKITRADALPGITKEVEKRNPRAIAIRFMFWADGITSTGPTPLLLEYSQTGSVLVAY